MYRFSFAVLTSLSLGWSSGCTPKQQGPPPAAQVKGTVTLGGTPLRAGEIHFGMAGVPPSVLEIKDGAFSGEAPVGKTQVEVFSYIDGPPSELKPGTPTKINIIPEKYWGPQTVLEATVTADGPNEFPFKLTK